MKNLEEVIGCRPEAFCDALVANTPEWVRNPLTYTDTLFLFNAVLKKGTNLAVEIGTGAGHSTTVLCLALSFASQTGRSNSDFSVVSYDASPSYYADATKPVGDVARGLLSLELLKHITFRNPALASSLKKHHGKDDIEFLFLDADHRHPWPTLDLLATLDLLKRGAVVVLHDVNLPLAYPEYQECQEWGAKYLFDGLDLEKGVPQDDRVPNISSIRIPEDKELLRARLIDILVAHEWEADVGADYLTQLDIVLAPHAP